MRRVGTGFLDRPFKSDIFFGGSKPPPYRVRLKFVPCPPCVKDGGTA